MGSGFSGFQWCHAQAQAGELSHLWATLGAASPASFNRCWHWHWRESLQDVWRSPWTPVLTLRLDSNAAECTSLRQLRGEHRFVRHEMLKAQNSLVMMVLKMCGTGIFVRKHAVSSPQVRAGQLAPLFSLDYEPQVSACSHVCMPHAQRSTKHTKVFCQQWPWVGRRAGRKCHCRNRPPSLPSGLIKVLITQVRVIIGGASLMFDRFRLSQALLLQAFNFLTFVIMEVHPAAAPPCSNCLFP